MSPMRASHTNLSSSCLRERTHSAPAPPSVLALQHLVALGASSHNHVVSALRRVITVRNTIAMPKPRARAAIGGPIYFSVSPWQNREERRHTNEDPAGYSIVEMPLVVRGSSGSGGGRGGSVQLAGAASEPDATAMDDAETAAGKVLTPQQPAAAAAAAPSLAAGDGWVTKKRKVAEEEPAAQPLAGPACPPPVHGGMVGELDAAAAEQGEHVMELEGTAYLALLPNGSVTGKRAVAVHGGQASRDWQLFAGAVHAVKNAGSGPRLPPSSQRLDAEAQRRWQLRCMLVLLLQFDACRPRLPGYLPAGHLVCAPSSLTGGGCRRSFGLLGEVVVAGRECTRDAGKHGSAVRPTRSRFRCWRWAGRGCRALPSQMALAQSWHCTAGSALQGAAPAVLLPWISQRLASPPPPCADWGVLRLTLVDFTAGGACRELSFLVERTEGDAMCLRCGAAGTVGWRAEEPRAAGGPPCMPWRWNGRRLGAGPLLGPDKSPAQACP